MSRAFELMLAEVHRERGHRQPVPRRRHHGAVRRAHRPRGPRARGPCAPRSGIERALAGFQAELAARGITFRARQGLNTGLVVVGSIGGDLRMDYTAVGDTTNVAARLQQVGEPGRVTISEATHRLVHGYFETRRDRRASTSRARPSRWRRGRCCRRARDAHPARGRVGARAHPVRRPRARAAPCSSTPSSGPAPGRARRSSSSGEAGIGKSRLLLELRRRVGDRGRRGRRGIASPSAAPWPFHPLIDLVRRRFGIEEADGEAAIGAKIERGVAEIGRGSGAHRAVSPRAPVRGPGRRRRCGP